MLCVKVVASPYCFPNKKDVQEVRFWVYVHTYVCTYTQNLTSCTSFLLGKQ